MKFKNCAIAYNISDNNQKNICNELRKEIIKYGYTFDSMDITQLKTGYDLVMVMGGDGTILKAARFYAGSDTIIFGINIGRA